MLGTLLLTTGSGFPPRNGLILGDLPPSLFYKLVALGFFFMPENVTLIGDSIL